MKEIPRIFPFDDRKKMHSSTLPWLGGWKSFRRFVCFHQKLVIFKVQVLIYQRLSRYLYVCLSTINCFNILIFFTCSYFRYLSKIRVGTWVSTQKLVMFRVELLIYQRVYPICITFMRMPCLDFGLHAWEDKSSTSFSLATWEDAGRFWRNHRDIMRSGQIPIFH